MPFTITDFDGLIIFEPTVFGDDRGYFFESYNKQLFEKNGININFVQDNQARSVYGVVRGLHFQKNPSAQTKLVKVLEGEILDVVVDIRKGSSTYGKSFSIILSAENKKQLLVPKGFAHGYAVLSPTSEVMYKCDEFYNKSAEGGIMYNDPALNINWGLPADKMLLSPKDLVLSTINECEHDFSI
jgi:dTDP-4-dehydrorhamnose 3,5-epimerase